MSKKLKELNPDIDITTIKLVVPSDVIQILTNVNYPIQEGYIVVASEDSNIIQMSHDPKDRNIRQIIQVQINSIQDIFEWNIAE